MTWLFSVRPRSARGDVFTVRALCPARPCGGAFQRRAADGRVGAARASACRPHMPHVWPAPCAKPSPFKVAFFRTFIA